jgi:iron complex transport system permease protein
MQFSRVSVAAHNHCRARGLRLQVLLWLVLTIVTLVTLLVCLGVGRIAVPPLNVAKVLVDPLLGAGVAQDLEATVIHSIRLPRALIAMLSGAGLAVAGAALQGALRNPLIGPQNIGVLSGAGFGGTLALLVLPHPLAVIATGFVGGLGAMLLVLWAARVQGRSTVLMLVLAGVVLSALFAALTTVLQYVADPQRELPGLVYWIMGSLAASNYTKLALIAPPVVLGTAILCFMAFQLNVLSSGDEEAYSLGIRVERARLTVLLAVSVVCAAVVAVGGLIAWVGLVVPHLARMIVGPNHRLLMPACVLVGATFLLVIDTICRSATAAEIPLGAATSLIGAPMFIYLLRRNVARAWFAD